jgi:hypothetical protein
MKKIFLSLAAMLVFGIASAQTEPKQQPAQPQPVNVTDDKDKAKKDAEIQNDVNHPNRGNEIVPRKDEIKTRDHVKSSPDTDKVKDTITVKRANKKATKRQ